MLSTEELLRKRYLVIAMYPNSTLSVGTIIEQVEVGENEYLFNMEFFEPYPHLFRPLEWWEFRDEKDMPEYLKHIGGRVHKPFVYFRNDDDEICFQLHKTGIPYDLTEFLPATLSEYAMFVSKEIDFKIGDVFESQVNTNLDIVGSKYSIVNINYEENTIQFNNGMAISIVGLTEAVINDKYKKLKNV